ncbi:hypothetical protein H8L32_16300 [Undibacterium sp. CY18W]|uniref:Uncharacterized protein n=1 Tax=Undibacterium hunanense TaxID=2762292 RepID=A0ABR6ZT73_9BURK|nr:hypothetical protein [Undibacterium hunanense]MBC3919054.1 hypothetical protein [Undibacterium hunanense]
MEIEKEAYIRRMSGNPDFSGTVPEDVNDLIAQGKIVAAIKSLKVANPKVEIQELRCYTRYLQNRYLLKKSG